MWEKEDRRHHGVMLHAETVRDDTIRTLVVLLASEADTYLPQVNTWGLAPAHGQADETWENFVEFLHDTPGDFVELFQDYYADMLPLVEPHRERQAGESFPEYVRVVRLHAFRDEIERFHRSLQDQAESAWESPWVVARVTLDDIRVQWRLSQELLLGWFLHRKKGREHYIVLPQDVLPLLLEDRITSANIFPYDDAEVTETTLGLWVPGSPALGTLSSAYEAARRIHT